MLSQLSDILWNINSEIAKLSHASLGRLTEVLDMAELELTRDLAKASFIHAAGNASYTAQMHRNALIQIRKTLESIRGPLHERIASALRHGGQLAANLATRHLFMEVQKFSSIFEHSVRPIAIEAATIIADGKRVLWKRFDNSAARYTGAIGEDIRRQLAVGLVRGETIDQITSRLAKHGGPKGLVYTRGRAGSPGARAEMISEGLFKKYRYYAERLARTEIVNAYNQTALDGMADLNDDDPGYFKRWDAAIDGRLCPDCGSLDDQIVPIDSNFRGGVEAPPLHPNCFLPDTRLGARPTNAMRSWYNGEIIEIKTRSGKCLRVTINHPVSTEHGFRAASTLRKGDKVLSQNGEIWRRSIKDFSQIHKDYSPPSIYEIFSALQMSIPSFRSVIAHDDLHGDARFTKGYIDIIGSASKLRNPLNNFLNFMLPKSAMEHPIHSSFSSGNFCRHGVYTPLTGSMSRSYLISSLVNSHTRPFNSLRFGLPSRGNSRSYEPVTESASTDSSLTSKLIFTFPQDIALDEIIEIRNFFFSGHVYNLETTTGWMIAEGIYTSNCRCAVVVWRKEWDKDRKHVVGDRGVGEIKHRDD